MNQRMQNSRLHLILLTIALQTALIVTAPAQQRQEILATSKLRSFTAKDLSAEIRDAYLNQKRDFAQLRLSLLSQFLAEKLLDLEAKATGSSAENLIEMARKGAEPPSEKQISDFYAANAKNLNGLSLEESRKQIAEYLTAQAEQKKIGDLIDRLRQKYKATLVKDINSPLLKPADIIARIGATTITAAEYNSKFRIFLNDDLHYRYEDIRADLIAVIFDALIEHEARQRGIEPSELIATEITDKMRDFSNGEREALENNLKNRLFAIYAVKILLKEPPIIRQAISTSDAPFLGPANAPVTIVMFSDFECPACAATHPFIKQLVQDYQSKVRLVIRNFPLREIHPQSFDAAAAAAAAHRQGKFFEYIELLYRNQSLLDSASLYSYAEQLGLDTAKFRSNMADAQIKSNIEKDIADGLTYGVSSTPTIFVNGVKVHRLSAEAFRRAIDREMSLPPADIRNRVRR
ncbi:MAG: DsbA family protein [Pyrinomonadaceae bacterium]